MKNNRVIIIGAGAAGLSAAKELVEHPEIEYIHLEAQEIVGGRVQTFPPEHGIICDSGATFIQVKDLTLYKEAKRRELLSQSGKTVIMMTNRYLSMWNFFLRHMLFKLYKVNKVFTRFYNSTNPQQNLDQLITAIKLSPTMAQFLRNTFGTALACAIDQIGVVALQQSMQQANVRPERDFVDLALNIPLANLVMDIYAQEIKQVLTEHAVTSINYQNDSVQIQCSNGKLFEVDKVIITVPLAILKRQQIQFIPPLPIEHQQAISSLGMGQGLKLQLKFSKAFWNKAVNRMVNIDGLFHFWIMDHVQAVMVVFYVATVDEKLDEQEILDKILTRLNSNYPVDVASLLVSKQIQNWSTNPYIGGLYSYDAIGSEGARGQLQIPIANNLFFAGEATIEGHSGTVDGAIESGKRAAQQLIESYG